MLVEEAAYLACGSCAARYEIVGGIPDLRLPGPSWIDFQADKAAALRLLAEAGPLTGEELVRKVFGARADWASARVDNCTRRVMMACDRSKADLDGWLKNYLTHQFFLEVGCGPGTLLAAAADKGYRCVGIDVSMVWLVVAQHLLLAAGHQPVLAAANAEALPLAAGSAPAVVSLDVIEHVSDPARFLSEIARVTEPGGYFALTTPNRFSLSAEPHVSIWGVGWLPRRWQRPYVKWRTGDDYSSTILLSIRELRNLVRRHATFQTEIGVPTISEDEIACYASRRALLARVYNRLALIPALRSLFLRVGPFFRIVGRKLA